MLFHNIFEFFICIKNCYL